MEPRPQRPRAQSGHQQPARQQAVPPQDPRAPQADYPIGVDPTAFVAPPRTEYDYSPLDLAPPGQRRRRQLVAAAVGGLSVLLLGAIIFFAFLLLNEDDPPNENDDLLAAQTQVANDAATVAANQTVVAQAAEEQTAQAGGGEEEGDTPTEESAATEEPEATEPAGAGEETAAAEETPAASGDEGADDGTEGETPAAPDLSGNASLDGDGLLDLLPGQEQVPADLTTVVDTTRTEEQVVESLGGGRPAESSLAEWGWSGNVERSFENPDPANADPASTTYLSVSIHGFDGPESAEAALPFYAEILVASGSGYTEIDAPDIGDEAKMFSVNDANGGTWITLYVRDGSVMYRIFAVSPGGDPTEDVIAVANELVGA